MEAVTDPTNINGIIKKLKMVYCQHKKSEIVKDKAISVTASTYGGIESVATPLITVVSDCMTPERTGVEFSGKSKNPIFLTKMLS